MAAHNENESQKKQEIFDRNVATTKAWIQCFADKDLDTLMDLMADDVQYHPAQYNGNVLVNKEGTREVVQWYYDNFRDIVFHEGIGLTREKSNGFFGGSVYPQNDNPNVVAVYGTWTPIHMETGKQVFNKWHGVIEFNEAGKMIYFCEFFDVNGMQAQLEDAPQSDEPANVRSQPASE